MKKSTALLIRLSAMMFVEFFITGSILNTMGLVLSKSGLSSIIGLAYSIVGISAIISPLIIGMIADRFIASQKMMAILHISSFLALAAIPTMLLHQNTSGFLVLLFIHNLLYLPTTALANNLLFRNLENNTRSYAYVRVFGTIGFMAAGFFIGQSGFSASTTIFYVAACSSLLLGLYCLSLPDTPPTDKGLPFSFRDMFFVDAFRMFRDPSFFIFMLCSVIIFVPQAAYQSLFSVYLVAKGFNNIASLITIGPVTEVIFLYFLPFILRKIGFRNVFLLGSVLWVTRLLIFSFAATSGANWILIGGILLHGACWDFFFTTGEIYTDKKAARPVKARAQSMYKVFSQGLGWAIGGYIAGQLYNHNVTAQGTAALRQWQTFWLYPAAIALAVGLIFLFFFRDRHVLEPADEIEKKG